MKIKILIFLFLLSLTNKTFSQLNDTNISVIFKIKNLGFNVDGYFEETSVVVNFDKTRLEESKIEGVLKVESIKTGIKKRDEHLLEKEYFDVKNYPEISLKSEQLNNISGHSYQLIANLKIKNITKKIVIPIEIEDNESSLKLSANFEINRRDFDVGGKSWSMSDTVKVEAIYVLNKN